MLGLFSADVPIPALAVMFKELTIIGSNTYGTDRRGPEFRGAVDLLPRYREEIAVLQTHRVPLAQVEDAFRVAADKRSGAIKVTVLAGPEG